MTRSLLDQVTHFCRIYSSFNLVAIEIYIQIKVFVFETLSLNQEFGSRIPPGKLRCKNLDGFRQRSWFNLLNVFHVKCSFTLATIRWAGS